MKSWILKSIELVSNILIIAIVVGLSAFYIFHLPAPEMARPKVGSVLSIPGEHFSANQETLVLALQDTCHLCSESAPFYRQLEQRASLKKGLHLMVVLPAHNDPLYVKRLGLSIDDIKLVPLASLNVGGTPTLIWIDNAGIIKKAWIGKLLPHYETDLFTTLGLPQTISSCNQCDVTGNM
jgi:hypothetical protein